VVVNLLGVDVDDAGIPRRLRVQLSVRFSFLAAK